MRSNNDWAQGLWQLNISANHNGTPKTEEENKDIVRGKKKKSTNQATLWKREREKERKLNTWSKLHGNAVEIDGSKYQRQNLNPAELHNPAIKTGKFKKIYQREKPKKNNVRTESDVQYFWHFMKNEFWAWIPV